MTACQSLVIYDITADTQPAQTSRVIETMLLLGLDLDLDLDLDLALWLTQLSCDLRPCKGNTCPTFVPVTAVELE